MDPIIVDIAKDHLGDKYDIRFVAGDRLSVQAAMFARPMMFVHQLTIVPDLPHTRRVALVRALTAYAQGWAYNRPVTPAGCLFQVLPGNATMEKFASTLGGNPEPGLIHRIDYTP